MIVFAFLIFLTGICFGQEIRVFHVEGGDFTYTSGGRRVVYQPEKSDWQILSLGREDIIQTGPDSFVEIRINPGGIRIKIAENTSLICNGAGVESGSLSFSILYGRIRLSTLGYWPHEEGGGSVFIQSGAAEAVFTKGDVGIDFIVSRAGSSLAGGEPVFRTYSFSGTVEIIPSARPDALTVAPRFQVLQFESLSIESRNPLFYVEHKALENEIVDYWNRHSFSEGAPLLSIKSPELSVPPPPAKASPAEPAVIEKTVIQYRNPDYGPFIKAGRIKNAFIITGGLFLLGGITLQSMSAYRVNNMDDRTSDLLWNYGYAPLGLGILFLGGAILINPRLPEIDTAGSDAAK
jgi:hypothetical protein